jgi:hypothetical protein
MNPYDDKTSRQQALEILNQDPECKCRLNNETATTDITCKDYYVDVKELNQFLFQHSSLGVNDYSYNKYITMDKPVYVLYILLDGYAMFDANTPYWVWKGEVNDKAKGRIERTIYNWNMDKAIKLEYYEH